MQERWYQVGFCRFERMGCTDRVDDVGFGYRDASLYNVLSQQSDQWQLDQLLL
jgi:hypothetical protein